MIIKPSRYFRVFYYACLIIGFCAALYSAISPAVMLLSGLLFFLVCYSPDDSEVTRLVWDLDRQSLRLLCADGRWQDGLAIEKIHLLPCLCFFRVLMKSGKRVSIGVFPDSLSSDEFRQLKVALKLGKMALVSKAIRS